MFYKINTNPKHTKIIGSAETIAEIDALGKEPDFEVVVAEQADLEGLKMGELVELHNVLKAKDETEVRRFTDKVTAAKRIWPLIVEAKAAGTRKPLNGNVAKVHAICADLGFENVTRKAVIEAGAKLDIPSGTCQTQMYAWKKANKPAETEA